MSDEVTVHRRAMVNIYLLIICQLLSWLTLLVNIIYCGDSYEVSITDITTTEIYKNGEKVTFTMGIPEFKKRYCDNKTKTPEICNIVGNLAKARWYYNFYLVISVVVVIYCLANIWFTAYSSKMPKVFSFNYMHFLYPITYAIGSILYFTASKCLTLEKGFAFAPGFYLMVSIVFIAGISAIFNKIKLNTFVDPEEKQQPLLES